MVTRIQGKVRSFPSFKKLYELSVQSLTFLRKSHDSKKMNPPSFHTRIRKVGALGMCCNFVVEPKVGVDDR
jgi:hypothetical protein